MISNPAGMIYGNKRRGRLRGENGRLLLMIKAQGNEEIGRVSKAWSPAEAKRYGAPPKMASLFGDVSESSSSDEESVLSSDEEENSSESSS